MGFLRHPPEATGGPRLRRGRRAALIAEKEIGRYFEESLELLWTADATGRLQRVNPAWRRCLGHPAEAMCGRPLTDFIHDSDRDAAAAEILSLADGSSRERDRDAAASRRSRAASSGWNGGARSSTTDGLHPRFRARRDRAAPGRGPARRRSATPSGDGRRAHARSQRGARRDAAAARRRERVPRRRDRPAHRTDRRAGRRDRHAHRAERRERRCCSAKPRRSTTSASSRSPTASS